MDIYMPGMNGFITAEKLIEQGFKGKIYALSAQEDIEESIHSKENQFSGYINKPLSIEALSAILN
jgi:DNA-binding NarL/FixJ family response regulator